MHGQVELFATGEPERSGDAVEPAVSPALESLAAYARHPLRRTEGIDRTFYAPIPVGRPTPNLRSGLTYEDAKARYCPFDRLVDEDPATRAALTDLRRRALADAQPAFVIANNKAEGSARLTIVKLAETIAGAR